MENKDYVSPETAKLLKEAGYDNPRIKVGSATIYFINFIKKENIPSYSAQRWLREVCELHVEISIENYTDSYIWQYRVLSTGESFSNRNLFYGEFNTYEKALDSGIKEACKLIIK